MKRAVACLGNSGSIAAWSNIPYYFFHAGLDRNFFTDALDLDIPNYETERLVWRLGQALKFKTVLGYQNSRSCARRMWEMVPDSVRKGEIISHFQTFPYHADAERSGCRFGFYCDATLRQLREVVPGFDAARDSSSECFKREREGYRHAWRVVAMSRACARSLVDDYGVDSAKVAVVRPGANMDESVVRHYLAAVAPRHRRNHEFSVDNPLRIGFVGVDYLRKGLPKLVEVVRLLNGLGYPAGIVAVGGCPEDIAKLPFVEYHGRIDKTNELGRFLEVVDSFHLGALLSESEPLGISTLECLRLGVPVMGNRVGGIPDCIREPFGLLFERTEDPRLIAEALIERVFDVQEYSRMVTAAQGEQLFVTWDNTVERFAAVWK